MPGTKPEEASPGQHGKDEEQSSVDKGKQKAVAESEDDDDEDIPESNVVKSAEETGDLSAPSAAKKKKTRRKKVHAALAGKSSDPMSQAKAAMDKLPPHELAELMQKNPALVQELAAQTTGPSGSSSGSVDAEKVAEIFKKLNLNDIMTGLALSGKNAKDMASYKFWKTQPVPKFDDDLPSEPIEEGPLRIQKLEDVPKEPPELLPNFEWVTLDLTDDTEIKEVYELLNGHYVEDNEAMFRFNYHTEILKWALMSPGWKKEWHIGIRSSLGKRPLLAFISAVPVELRVRDKVLHCSEVNFICVHKKLRGKRLAPILIKEITRLCNLGEVWQAVYTAGVVLPKPVSTCRYYHRALDWTKLYEVGFSPLPRGAKPEWQVRKYALPGRTAVEGLREMQKKDVPAVQLLLKRYLKRYDMAPEWSLADVEHWLLPTNPGTSKQLVWTYVVETEAKTITDFFSFYSLESTVINNVHYNTIRAAYLFYYATETGLTVPLDKPAFKARLNQLMGDALVLAKREKFDVFNALSLMDNSLFLEKQKFGGGDGQLHYYLFNYRANPIAGGVTKSNQADEEGLSGIGFVML